ncbi:Asp23/Gls24 family envelope stress response protein [Nocardiopsis alkaliphila]|uniref:Asp23/Gls24 family envelope stress response protein n=1 Tax=Nocardiopsis alkaliphila TaxID=225762 RepID=UPI00034BD3F3|nr:Asp23/Gls24 family envelope stress response protein [Nocardiopsis alkaliphila]
MTGVHAPGRTARALAEAAVRFPDVVELSSGAFGTLGTPVRGGRISGVTVRDDHVEIGVVVKYGRPLPEIATELRRDLAALAGGRVVHVSVEDVVAGLDDGTHASG